jgi:hypothetical protein
MPLIPECNVYNGIGKDLMYGLVHQIITINVDAIASISIETLGKIDKDGSISPDSYECFSISMNNGEKFYCAVDVFLKHQNEILQSIRSTTDIHSIDTAIVRNLFDIEALRKTV